MNDLRISRCGCVYNIGESFTFAVFCSSDELSDEHVIRRTRAACHSFECSLGTCGVVPAEVDVFKDKHINVSDTIVYQRALVVEITQSFAKERLSTSQV